jgi:hypothetical protein
MEVLKRLPQDATAEQAAALTPARIAIEPQGPMVTNCPTPVNRLKNSVVPHPVSMALGGGSEGH